MGKKIKTFKEQKIKSSRVDGRNGPFKMQEYWCIKKSVGATFNTLDPQTDLLASFLSEQRVPGNDKRRNISMVVFYENFFEKSQDKQTLT